MKLLQDYTGKNEIITGTHTGKNEIIPGTHTGKKNQNSKHE